LFFKAQENQRFSALNFIEDKILAPYSFKFWKKLCAFAIDQPTNN
jgi:hypothetical protein